MKMTQNMTLTDRQLAALLKLGTKIAKLRIARNVTQLEAALRANISRSTASNIEKGSPSVAVGQIARYLDAIAPGKTLEGLFLEPDAPSVLLDASTTRRRASPKSKDDEPQEFKF